MRAVPIRPLPAARVAAAAEPWRWARLLGAPHRLGFAAAALLMAVSALWWAFVLGCRAVGVALPWALPAPFAHGLLLACGFMPLFITGFLFTAGPRWLGLPDVAAAVLRWPVLLMVAGWCLALAGCHLAAPAAALGLAALALGWSLLMRRFAGLLRRSPAADTLHATLILASGTVGAVLMWAAALALAGAGFAALRAITQLALWCFLAPVFAVVSHRMIPFFTASTLPGRTPWRPDSLLWAMLAVLWLEGAGAATEAVIGPLPAALRWAQVAVEAPAAVLLLWLALRWGLLQSLKFRLLAMLHAGFVWLGISIALAAITHALAALQPDASLGLAPLHALTLGYLGTTLIAMTTRVAAGHSGRALAADDIAWALYWAWQTAAVLRVAAALWPAQHGVLTLAAAAAWVLAAVGWALRYGRWLGRPRADGRPG